MSEVSIDQMRDDLGRVLYDLQAVKAEIDMSDLGRRQDALEIEFGLRVDELAGR